jgi:hypothetical protein
LAYQRLLRCAWLPQTIPQVTPQADLLLRSPASCASLFWLQWWVAVVVVGCGVYSVTSVQPLNAEVVSYAGYGSMQMATSIVETTTNPAREQPSKIDVLAAPVAARTLRPLTMDRFF